MVTFASDIPGVAGYNNSFLTKAQHGTLRILDTNAHAGRFGGFYVESDAVIASIQVNGAAATLSDYGLTGTIKAGTEIFMEGEKTITSITLTSGTIVAINR